MQKKNTTALILCAIFAALTGVCSWISIPLPFTPVPVNLATLAVFLAGGLLGKKYAALSMTVYLALGIVGAPVFHGFTSGPGIVMGPTGGYIFGYILGAFLIGWLLPQFNRSTRPTVRSALSICAMTVGLAGLYCFGTIWFMILTGSSLIPALLMCVVPFLPGDALKMLAALFLIAKLKPHIKI